MGGLTTAPSSEEGHQHPEEDAKRRAASDDQEWWRSRRLRPETWLSGGRRRPKQCWLGPTVLCARCGGGRGGADGGGGHSGVRVLCTPCALGIRGWRTRGRRIRRSDVVGSALEQRDEVHHTTDAMPRGRCGAARLSAGCRRASDACWRTRCLLVVRRPEPSALLRCPANLHTV